MAPEDHLKSLPWLARCFERVGEASMKNAVGKLLCILDPNGRGHGENQRSKDVFFVRL